ncbi:MAG TPA: hypothetical protein VFN67_20585 [Polyangiales bacterium]|nr:hypothetical protein [Polyangiales bacterium]
MRVRQLASVSLCACLLGCVTTSGAQRTDARESAEQSVPPALRKELDVLAHSLERVGLRASGRGLWGFMLAGSHATLPVTIAANSCVTVVARATRGARDVDAALYAADGRLLALDSGAGPNPAVQACAKDASAQAYYVIQFYDGDGSFVALPYVGSREASRKAAAAAGGKLAFAEIVDAPEVAEEPVSALTEGLRKRGFNAVGEPRQFAIAQGERVRSTLPVEAGQCYTVASFGGPGVQALRLRLLDDQGQVVSEADDATPRAAAQLCARATAPYAIEAESAEGAGEVLVLTYRVDVLTAGGDAGLWLGYRPDATIRPSAKQPTDTQPSGNQTK